MQPAQLLTCTPDDFTIGFWLGVVIALGIATILFTAIHLLFGPRHG